MYSIKNLGQLNYEIKTSLAILGKLALRLYCTNL